MNALRFSDIELSDMSVLIMDLMYAENAVKNRYAGRKAAWSLGIDVTETIPFCLTSRC